MSSNGKEDGTPGKPKPEKGNSEVKKSSDEHCNKKNGGDDFMTRMGAGLRDLNVDDPSGGGRETKSVPAGVKGKNRTDSLEDDPGFIASMEKAKTLLQEHHEKHGTPYETLLNMMDNVEGEVIRLLKAEATRREGRSDGLASEASNLRGTALRRMTALLAEERDRGMQSEEPRNHESGSSKSNADSQPKPKNKVTSAAAARRLQKQVLSNKEGGPKPGLVGNRTGKPTKDDKEKGKDDDARAGEGPVNEA